MRKKEVHPATQKQMKPEVLPIRDRVREQRNKVYAHNDRIKISSVELSRFLKENKLFYDDLRTLIRYALDVTRFVIGALTGKEKPELPVNYDDFKSILRMVELSDKYKDLIIAEEMK